jgi:hypothetical protein
MSKFGTNKIIANSPINHIFFQIGPIGTVFLIELTRSRLIYG